MDNNQLALFAGVVLSLVLSYVPGLNAKFNGLDGAQKRLVVLGVLAAAAGLIFGAGCAGIDIPGVALKVSCNQAGAVGLINAFLAAVVGNQAAYLVSPKS